ncbi:hypothetical protein C3L33_02301, partial [Rhododendron williamsianum]
MVQVPPFPPVVIISDIFLGWTHHLASHLGVPHVAFWTSSAFAASVFHTLWRYLPKVDDPTDKDAVLSMPKVPNSPKYPWWQITSLYRGFKEGNPDWEFFRNGILANGQSWGELARLLAESVGGTRPERSRVMEVVLLRRRQSKEEAQAGIWRL